MKYKVNYIFGALVSLILTGLMEIPEGSTFIGLFVAGFCICFTLYSIFDELVSFIRRHI